MLELRAIIHGRVQGVGFRATAHVLASEMGLNGFIRNENDGTVEICAQGEKQKLEELLERLKGLFQISQIDISFTQSDKIFDDFDLIT